MNSQVANFRQTVLQPGRLGEIDPEPLPSALVTASHLGAGMAELFLNVTLVDLGSRGQAGAQRVSGELLPPLGLSKRVKGDSAGSDGDMAMAKQLNQGAGN